MSTPSKIKIYALFQFLTFISYFILGIAFFVLALSANEWDPIVGGKSQGDWLTNLIIYLFIFQISGPFGITASILIYTSIILIVMSWIIGLQVLRSKNRNLLDSLFLLFAFIPLIANMLCLIAQVSSNTIAIDYKIDKQEEFKKQYSKAKTSKEAQLKELKQKLYDLKRK